MTQEPASSEPTIFLIDDDQPVLDSLAELVAAAGFHPLTFSSAEEFLDNFNSLATGCIVTDLRLTGMSGQDLQRRLIEMGCPLPLIVVTGHATVPVAVQIMEDGAVTLLQKPYKPTELLSAIQRALDRPVKSRPSDGQLVELKQRLSTLNEEEHQVMRLLLEGRTNKVIAATLSLSMRTVDRRRRSVLDKAGVESVPELARLAGILQSAGQ